MTLAQLPILLGNSPKPALTWYWDGERAELSGKVVANWLAKLVNLLTAEVGAGPGTLVGLDLPPHWRSVLWAQATWLCGGTVVVAEALSSARAAGDLSVLVTSDPTATVDPDITFSADLVFAQALPTLALSYPFPLAAGVLDASAEIMSYPDTLGPHQAADPAGTAILGGPSQGTLGRDLPRSVGGQRPLLLAEDVLEPARELLARWQQGQTAVFVSPDPQYSDSVLARIAEIEGCAQGA